MNTKTQTLFTAIALLSVVFISTPSYADVINTSFKSGGKANKSSNKAKPNCKGRNRSSGKTSLKVRSSNNRCRTSKKTASFKQPKIGGLRIDVCVRGTGWKNADPKRCDKLRLKKVANGFCKSKGFKRSRHVTKSSHKGRHAVLAYKKSKPSSSYWKQKKGHTVIKSIVCQK